MRLMTRPQDNLSVKLMAPYTKAPLSTFDPIRSAVIDREVTSMAEPPPPERENSDIKLYSHSVRVDKRV